MTRRHDMTFPELAANLRERGCRTISTTGCMVSAFAGKHWVSVTLAPSKYGKYDVRYHDPNGSARMDFAATMDEAWEIIDTKAERPGGVNE